MKQKQKNNLRLTHLMCRVSDGVYKKHLEKRLGIKACFGNLNDTDIQELGQDIELLKYLFNSKDRISEKCCDLNKLIENLT
jgi:hypothetical protein